MGDVHEQTIVISDLLSFLACKIKLVSKEKLLKTLRQYYSEKDINEAHRTLLASLPEKKSTRHGRRVKNPDPLVAMYDCFQLIPEQDLPIFVCKNLNNVPELDIIKQEPQEEGEEEEIDDETETEMEVGVEQTLREEQKTMKSQIADIAFVVKQLKDQLDNISQQTSFKSSEEISRVRLKRKGNANVLKPNKKINSESDFNENSKLDSNVKKKGLAYLQSLIDEDEEKSDKDQSEKDSDSDFQEELDYSDPEYEDFEDSKGPESISCEVILKEEPEEEHETRILHKNVSKKNRDIFLASPTNSGHKGQYMREGSPSKTIGQKVIYIKNEEDRDQMEDDENSIEIASASDYLGNLDDTDPSSRIGTLDSIITISKNSSSESIIIEKIEATNGEGYYYKCQRCEFICNEEKMILKHECNSITVDVRNRKPRRKERDRSDMWVCTICDAYVIDVVEFNEHMLDHYKIAREKGIYECVLCTLKTDRHDDYKSHLLEHSWKIPYVCDLCDYKSTKELRMRNHAVKHLECKGPNHFECLRCGKICGTRNALEKHKQRHRKNYDFKCEICGLTFRHRSALSQHTLNHTKERTYVCHICSYRYDSQHSLDVHVKVHFRDDLFTCHICNQKFKSKNAFRNHVLSTHEGIKPFKCDLCNEAFIFKHTMLMHRKTHGNQFYVCGYCNKKFKSQHYLKIHCAIHEGKNPFKCSSCDFETSSKAILRKHTIAHSESETLNLLSCEDCNYVTVCSTELEKHIRVSHSNSMEENKMVIIMENS